MNRRLLVVLILALPFVSRSQPPSPTPAKETQENKAKPDNVKVTGDLPQPLPVGSVGNQTTYYGQNSTSYDWGPVIIGVIAICVAYSQLRIYKKQTGVMTKALEATKQAANAASGQLSLMSAQNAVATSTLEAIKEQAGVMRSQVAAMDRQIKIQEASMRQWIECGAWSSEIRMMDKGGQVLFIEGRIVNGSNYPLTLPEARIVFLERHGNTLWSVAKNYTLVPQNRIPIEMSFSIDDDQLAWFDNGTGIVIAFYADLSHIGVLGDRTDRHLTGRLQCSRHGTHFTETIESEERYQNAFRQPVTPQT